MRSPYRWAIPALALAASLAGAGRLAGQERPADLPALLALAEAQNPELAAASKTAEAAAARVPQAGALPDPMLGLGVVNLPVKDPRLGQDFMTMATVGISETFPFPGKLALREGAARFQARASSWETERVRQTLMAEVKRAYYELYFLDRSLDITARNQALVADFARLTAARYAVGGGAQADVLRAQVERTALGDQLVALGERRVAAAARLNALVGRPTGAALPQAAIPDAVRRVALSPAERGAVTFAAAARGGNAAAPGIPPVEELQRLALERNPMIQAHVQRIEAQERGLALAKKAGLPDFRVMIGYAQRSGFRDMLSAQVSVPLPIFSGRKQGQQVVEESALLAVQQARHHAMVNELNAEIAALVAGLARAHAQLALLHSGILPQARAALASASAAYQVDRVDFLALLDAQVTLYRHELDSHRLLADFAADLAALERAVGAEVVP